MEHLSADKIRRGLGRFLLHQGWAWLPEVTLPNNRRADVMAIDTKGKFLIVEIKSSLQDYQTDNKWREYQPYCDMFGFCVAPDFPSEVIPDDVGLVISDSFGAELIRPYASEPLAPARRKSLTLKFATLAARRNMATLDPEAAGSWLGDY